MDPECAYEYYQVFQALHKITQLKAVNMLDPK